MIGPPLVARLSVPSYAAGGTLTIFSMMFGFGTIVSTVAWTLVMLGLVKIASPPQEFDPSRPPGG